MKNPLISVIVPVYNVEKYIHNCIDSVLNQTYQNWELILVDDGSPDNCPKICDNYAEKDKRIQVIHKKNGGLSSARNAALDVMKGEYVTFLDSDDFWHIDYLREMIKLCIENNADISQCENIRGTDVVFPANNLIPNIKIYTNHSIFTSFGAVIIMWEKLYKSSLFKGVRMPLGKINEDDFTAWKLYYKSNKIVVSNKPYYYYTCNPKSIMSIQKKVPKLDFLEAYDERINFFINKKEKVLEEMSRLQFCKALLLTWGNRNLTNEQRIVVAKMFKNNWINIKKSKYIPVKFKCLFRMFSRCPYFTLKIVNLLRK